MKDHNRRPPMGIYVAMFGALAIVLGAGCSSDTVVQFAKASEVSQAAPVAQTMPAPAAKKSKLPVAGDVLVAGGVSGLKASVKAEFYDPTTKKWTATGSLTTGRMAACGLILEQSPQGMKVLVAGGAGLKAKTKGQLTLTITPQNTADEYDGTTGQFTPAGTMTAARAGCTATQLDDGTILIAGGLDATGAALTSAEIFNPATGTFTATTGQMNSPRAFHSATYISSGSMADEVLLAGGLSDDTPGSPSQGATLNTAELYNPLTQTFTAVSPMITSRALHTATTLADGTILLAGGDSDPVPGFAFGGTTNAEVFNPVTQTFSAVGSMVEPLAMQSATLLAGGSVLIAGGFDAVQAVIFTNGSLGAFFGSTSQGAEIYDPVAQTFSCVSGTVTDPSTGSTVCASTMHRPHAGHAAALLGDGTVLIAGGYGGAKISSKPKPNKIAEIYDPATQSFTKVGAMKTALAQPVVATMQTLVVVAPK